MNKCVYIAMSGGVDSSVAAALLKKRRFDVVGVFMKPWQPETVSSIKYQVLNMGNRNQKIHNTKYEIRNTGCLWKEDREDAMRAASVIGIPLLTWDFSRQYKKSVTDYMIREYKAGRTPNPDVMCNKEIKFGLFYKKAMKAGADFIATGHYIRKSQSVKRGAQNAVRYTLHVARDKNKDQSYFLWTLNQRILSKCIFPIGDYTKPEVRKMAKKFGLPNHAKKDSQGVCFIGPLDMKDFLTKHIKPRKGKIVHVDPDASVEAGGRVIGEHDGVSYYTIGQRHGLNIGTGGGPYYVVSKDIKKNIIYVGSEKDLLNKNAKITEISWVNGGIKFPGELNVRLRYRAVLKRAVLKKNGELELKTPERAITEGQSAVFYRGSRMLGGGIIA